MTESVRKDIENRAAIVIRGLANPESGWYDSPDDLQAVIEGQLAAVWLMAKKDEILSEGWACVGSYGKIYATEYSPHDACVGRFQVYMGKLDAERNSAPGQKVVKVVIAKA